MNKRNIRRTAWILILVFLTLTIWGCDGNRSLMGEKTSLKLPKEIVVLADAPEIQGSPVAASVQDSAAVAAFSEQLMKNALAEAREHGAKNVVLSPVSVYLALLVTANLSEEAGQTSFEQVLSLPKEQWSAVGNKWMRHMNWQKEEACVSASNSVWVDEGMSLEQGSVERIAKELYTDVYQGDLQSVEIVEAVNAWVEHSTHGMIEEFLGDPYDPTIVLSILNAVYLEAKWQDAFMASGIREKTFYTEEGKEVVTEFMTDYLCQRSYFKLENMDGVVLPYKDGNLAFVALRPARGQSVDELLQSLDWEDWGTFYSQATNTLMDFSIPKFTVEYDQELTEVIGGMGADLPLGIGQKVKIRVDEEGTKAAAVTQVTAAGAIAATEEPIEVHLDHPFVYGVVDLVTGIPLFVGVMDCPGE